MIQQSDWKCVTRSQKLKQLYQCYDKYSVAVHAKVTYIIKLTAFLFAQNHFQILELFQVFFFFVIYSVFSWNLEQFYFWKYWDMFLSSSHGTSPPCTSRSAVSRLSGLATLPQTRMQRRSSPSVWCWSDVSLLIVALHLQINIFSKQEL